MTPQGVLTLELSKKNKKHSCIRYLLISIKKIKHTHYFILCYAQFIGNCTIYFLFNEIVFFRMILRGLNFSSYTNGAPGFIIKDDTSSLSKKSLYKDMSSYMGYYAHMWYMFLRNLTKLYITQSLFRNFELYKVCCDVIWAALVVCQCGKMYRKIRSRTY